MTEKTKITSCIICDIARKELGGKTSLLGVYSGSINVESFPATLSSFAIWIEVQYSKTKFDDIKIVISDPDNKPMIQVKGKLEITSNFTSYFREKEQYAGIPIQFSNATFEKAGKYTIKIGIDGSMKKIKEFFVFGTEKTAKPVKKTSSSK